MIYSRPSSRTTILAHCTSVTIFTGVLRDTKLLRQRSFQLFRSNFSRQVRVVIHQPVVKRLVLTRLEDAPVPLKNRRLASGSASRVLNPLLDLDHGRDGWTRVPNCTDSPVATRSNGYMAPHFPSRCGRVSDGEHCLKFRSAQPGMKRDAQPSGYQLLL